MTKNLDQLWQPTTCFAASMYLQIISGLKKNQNVWVWRKEKDFKIPSDMSSLKKKQYTYAYI